jgi:heat shock transcription factor
MKRGGQSLKRAAPGASPANTSPSPQIQPQDVQRPWTPLSDIAMNPAQYGAGSGEDAEFNGATLLGGESTAPTTAGELVRRNTNTQLAIPALNAWDDAQVTPWEDYDDDDQLDQLALEAQREATTKKRHIPPFVQKLSRCVVRSREDHANTMQLP